MRKQLAYDDVEILKISNRIVNQALQPQALATYILDHAEESAVNDLNALRTAIDSRYPGFRKRFEKGERGDVEAELAIIEAKVQYHIGVGVGRRVR